MTVPRESLNRMTWRDFQQLAESHGVTLETTRQPIGDSGQVGKYFCRTVGGRDFWCSLPIDCDLDEKIGMFRFENLCRRLQLDFNFTGWPMIL